MEDIIKNSQRLVKPKDVQEFLELTEFVDRLDAKYGINSENRENSFCCLNPEKPLVSHLYESNVYWYLYGQGDEGHLPERMHVALPFGKILTAGTLPEPEPLNMETKDKETLFLLRKKAKAALAAVYPAKPVFGENDTTPADWTTRLKEQDFAVLPFRMEFQVENRTFAVEYKKLDGNKAPYFSTTYDGWQSQDEMPHDSLAYRFYQKWEPFHLIPMAEGEYKEMWADLLELQAAYPYRPDSLHTWRKPKRKAGE